MKREIVTVETIRDAERKNTREIRVAACAVVTPSAREAARAAGIRLLQAEAGAAREEAPEHCDEVLVAAVKRQVRDKLPPGTELSEEALESAVRQQLASAPCVCGCDRFAPAQEKERMSATAGAAQPSLLCRAPDLRRAPGAPPGGIALFEGLLCPQNTMHAGYISWESGSFRRPEGENELYVVLEGEVRITLDGESFNACAGDLFCLPSGARAEFGAQGAVRLAVLSGGSSPAPEGA